MSAIDVDREGHEYGHAVVPDEIVGSNGGIDSALTAARLWLQRASSCK